MSLSRQLENHCRHSNRLSANYRRHSNHPSVNYHQRSNHLSASYHRRSSRPSVNCCRPCFLLSADCLPRHWSTAGNSCLRTELSCPRVRPRSADFRKHRQYRWPGHYRLRRSHPRPEGCHLLRRRYRWPGSSPSCSPAPEASRARLPRSQESHCPLGRRTLFPMRSSFWRCRSLPFRNRCSAWRETIHREPPWHASCSFCEFSLATSPHRIEPSITTSECRGGGKK